jgi:hypothetical protein
MPPTNDFLSPYGAPKYDAGVGKPASVATQAALTALAATHPARVHGNIVDVDADGSRWYWHGTSTLTADDLFVDAADDAPSAGRWIRAPGPIDLRIAIAFGTADAAILATLPTGAVLRIHDLIWEVTTSWTGGSSSAIGISSTKTGFSTKGDLLGGASGDVLATLVSTAPGGLVAGTAGAKADTLAEQRALLFVAADNFRFDRVTSAFTAGAGFLRIFGQLLRNAGA